MSIAATATATYPITRELGRLLVHVAGVATALRMNSAYNGRIERDLPDEIGLDVMWLADSLHTLDHLGKALQSGENERIEASCDRLLQYYKLFTEGADGRSLKGDPKASFERHANLCDPRAAITVFSNLRDQARMCIEDARSAAVTASHAPGATAGPVANIQYERTPMKDANQWLDALPQVEETDLQVRRDTIARMLKEADECTHESEALAARSRLLLRRSAELRAEAYAASAQLEGLTRSHYTDEQIEAAKLART